MIPIGAILAMLLIEPSLQAASPVMDQLLTAAGGNLPQTIAPFVQTTGQETRDVFTKTEDCAAVEESKTGLSVDAATEMLRPCIERIVHNYNPQGNFLERLASGGMITAKVGVNTLPFAGSYIVIYLHSGNISATASLVRDLSRALKARDQHLWNFRVIVDVDYGGV
jgi:hypothetical protein